MGSVTRGNPFTKPGPVGQSLTFAPPVPIHHARWGLFICVTQTRTKQALSTVSGKFRSICDLLYDVCDQRIKGHCYTRTAYQHPAYNVDIAFETETITWGKDTDIYFRRNKHYASTFIDCRQTNSQIINVIQCEYCGVQHGRCNLNYVHRKTTQYTSVLY